MRSLHLWIAILISLLKLSSCCKSDEFSCLNGQCIEKLVWCDGEIDCRDRSDESYCRLVSGSNRANSDPNKCLKNRSLYKCGNGRCIPAAGRCDGYDSCGDRSDELNCGQILKIVDHDNDTLNYVNNQRIERVEDSTLFAPLDYSEYKEALTKSREWLLSQQDSDFGWGDFTSRALIAMYLSKPDPFKKNGQDMLMDKQLEIKLSIALTKNDTNMMSLGELALYINALSASCKNPRNFNGYDLVNILKKRAFAAYFRRDSISPFVQLTLCIQNYTDYSSLRMLQDYNFPERDINRNIDMLSLSVLASSCFVKVTDTYPSSSRRVIVNMLLKRLGEVGLPGNVDQLSLLIQAFTEARVDPTRWYRNEAMDSLLKMQKTDGSFGDLLATYHAVPVLSGRSFLSLSEHCEKGHLKDVAPMEFLRSPKEKIHITYSLFYFEPADMSQKIELQIAEGTSFLDIMRVAQEENHSFRLQLDDTSVVPFVYSIGGIPNDPERGLYWTLYESYRNGTKYSPLQIDIGTYFPHDEQNLVFWLKPVL